jgi:hypothetical protein
MRNNLEQILIILTTLKGNFRRAGPRGAARGPDTPTRTRTYTLHMRAHMQVLESLSGVLSSLRVENSTDPYKVMFMRASFGYVGLILSGISYIGVMFYGVLSGDFSF